MLVLSLNWPLQSKASDALRNFCGHALDIIGSYPLKRLPDRLANRAPVTILAIGSSTTSGEGASSPDHNYPERLHAFLRSAWPDSPIRMINKGVSGDTTAMMLPRLRQALKDTDFDLVIWQVGSNDAINAGDAAALSSAMDQGIEAVLDSGSDLLLLDQQYVERWNDKQSWEHYVAAVEIGAKNKAIAVLSRYRSMKRLHGRDLPALAGLLTSDQIHMNDKGYACLAEAIGRSIQTIVDRSTAGAK